MAQIRPAVALGFLSHYQSVAAFSVGQFFLIIYEATAIFFILTRAQIVLSTRPIL